MKRFLICCSLVAVLASAGAPTPAQVRAESLDELVERMMSPAYRSSRDAPERAAAFLPDAAPRLISVLRDGNAEARADAAGALGWNPDAPADPRALEPLVSALTDDVPQVRANAARALWRYRGTRVVDALARALTDENINVRNEAAGSLIPQGDVRAAEALKRAALDQTEPSNVSSLATRAIVEIGAPAVDSLVADLASDDDRRVALAVELCAAISDERAVAPLLKVLRERRPLGSSISRDAAQVLTKLGPAGVAGLVAVLEDPDEVKTLRIVAARALGKAKTAGSLGPLVTTLSDASSELRSSAALALADLGDVKAVDPLLRALEDTDPNTRAGAVYALSEINARSAAVPVAKLLTDPVWFVRVNAVFAVRALGGEAYPMRLVPLLRDENPDVRMRTFWTLSDSNDPALVDTMAGLLRDDNPEFQERGYDWLIRRPDQSFGIFVRVLATPNPEFEARLAARAKAEAEAREEALAKRNAEFPIGLTCGDMSEPKPFKSRVWAAMALGRIGYGEGSGRTPASVGPLISALDDEDGLLRAEAAYSLYAIATPEQGYDDFRYHRIPTTSPLAGLASPDPATRREAVERLRRVLDTKTTTEP